MVNRSALWVVLACGAALGWSAARSPVAAAPSTSTEADGRTLFRRNCSGCHGDEGVGTELGPDLTDDEWLHIDGSYEAILSLVRKGVPEPKRAPAPMLPMGGAAFTDDELAAVTRYVFNLSH